MSNKTVIVFEEIDNVFDEDQGFYRALKQILRTAKCPIILTCNEFPAELDEPLPTLEFQSPPLVPTAVWMFLRLLTLATLPGSASGSSVNGMGPVHLGELAALLQCAPSLLATATGPVAPGQHYMDTPVLVGRPSESTAARVALSDSVSGARGATASQDHVDMRRVWLNLQLWLRASIASPMLLPMSNSMPSGTLFAQAHLMTKFAGLAHVHHTLTLLPDPAVSTPMSGPPLQVSALQTLFLDSFLSQHLGMCAPHSSRAGSGPAWQSVASILPECRSGLALASTTGCVVVSDGLGRMTHIFCGLVLVCDAGTVLAIWGTFDGGGIDGALDALHAHAPRVTTGLRTAFAKQSMLLHDSTAASSVASWQQCELARARQQYDRCASALTLTLAAEAAEAAAEATVLAAEQARLRAEELLRIKAERENTSDDEHVEFSEDDEETAVHSGHDADTMMDEAAVIKNESAAELATSTNVVANDASASTEHAAPPGPECVPPSVESVPLWNSVSPEAVWESVALVEELAAWSETVSAVDLWRTPTMPTATSALKYLRTPGPALSLSDPDVEQELPVAPHIQLSANAVTTASLALHHWRQVVGTVWAQADLDLRSHSPETPSATEQTMPFVALPSVPVAATVDLTAAKLDMASLATEVRVAASSVGGFSQCVMISWLFVFFCFHFLFCLICFCFLCHCLPTSDRWHMPTWLSYMQPNRVHLCWITWPGYGALRGPIGADSVWHSVRQQVVLVHRMLQSLILLIIFRSG